MERSPRHNSPRPIVVAVAAVVLAALAVFAGLALSSGESSGARFDAKASHFAWLFGHTYVTYDLTVTNVGGTESDFQCNSVISGSDGVDVNPGPVLAPGATTIIPEAATLVPKSDSKMSLAAVGERVVPHCETIPPINHVYVHVPG